FIIWADPQVKNAKDVQKMMDAPVPCVKKYLATLSAGTLIHGITVGDIVWDELKLFDEYNKAVAQMNIPFFQCLGNHDMDYRKGGDETSDDTFQLTYGPTYYSFNRGQVHYVVMDNVRYLGKERDYDGWVQQNQLDWLQKDLQFVPKDKLIVLCLHIPVHSGTKNRDALYALLEDRQVHIMSGHTHYNVNALNGNIYEHNHGTVCGAWWTGAICEDGTPNGYGIYKVKGTDLSWHYQSTGQTADHQMRIYATEYSGTEKQVVVNVWNADPAWKTEYWVDGVSKGPLEQFEGFDNDAYKSMLGPELPKPRGFAEPKKTKHLFKAIIPSGGKEVKVVVTDRFGKQFTNVQSLTA
ncbi:MAG TPA: calcineurin-like phosphoesterase C-terminal domain-containing protein, partial [Chitinophagaceae bacterium]|nr:calcineurin-like phosphoesterase C-terminal domain-containing protein [Chitinophagaceae bacterium]